MASHRPFLQRIRGRRRAVAALALAWIVSACAETDPAAEQAARDATVPWLERMDGGDYRGCWDAAAPWFREQISADGWNERARETRAPLGDFVKREFRETTLVSNPWGAPDGRYVIVVYASNWRKGNILENLAMQQQADGRWLLVGYHVKQRRGDG